MLRFTGSNYMRLRLVLSCLTGRPIRIEAIRADDEAPGLRTFEASFLRLVEKVSNGCVVEINETGVTRQLCSTRLNLRHPCKHMLKTWGPLPQVPNYGSGQG